ncbi:FAD-linked oxidoreductase hmp9 [Colletotrichum viniferum]|nr:FAD-linked oxidoreductase hmp9 [Colletotrichum viniferum]
MLSTAKGLVAAFAFAGGTLASACNCTPSDTCWPSLSEWESFNQTISGKLIRTVPLASVCYKSEPNYNEDSCNTEIIRGFTDIVSTATTALSQMQGIAAVPPGANADAMLEAFRGFVRVHQALLEILIGKAGLLSTVPFIGQPIAAVLRQIKSITLAFTLIDTVQGQASEIQSEANILSATIGDAITSYQGVNLD